MGGGSLQAGAWFRSTPPCGRRRDPSDTQSFFLSFRSTPPCGRRPLVYNLASNPGSVSIHASVREATWWWLGP